MATVCQHYYCERKRKEKARAKNTIKSQSVKFSKEPLKKDPIPVHLPISFDNLPSLKPTGICLVLALCIYQLVSFWHY